MTTQQDILRTMMTQLDDASDKIPEGLSTSSSVIISKTFTIRLDHFAVSDVVATKRAWGPLRKLHRFPQMNTDTWMFKITKKRLTECMVSVTEPTGDLRVRVAVVAAARWVTISVTAPTSSKT